MASPTRTDLFLVDTANCDATTIRVSGCFMICFCYRHRKLEHLMLWFLKCILHMFLPLLLQQECVKSSASQPSDCPRLALSLETQGQHITMWLVLFLRSQQQQLFALPASSEGHALFSHYWQLHTGTNFNGIVMAKWIVKACMNSGHKLLLSGFWKTGRLGSLRRHGLPCRGRGLWKCSWIYRYTAVLPATAICASDWVSGRSRTAQNYNVPGSMLKWRGK